MEKIIMEDFYWLNEHSRSFLERGYLKEGQLAEDRLKEIAKNAEKILGIKGFSEKFLGYLSKGFFSLSTPVWTNYGNKRGLPVSCISKDMWVNTIDGGKMAENIEIGDFVLTHKGRYRRVTDVIKTEKKDDIFILKVSSRNTPLKITGNHLIKTNLGWTRVDELDVDKHLVAVNGSVECPKPYNHTIDLGEYIYDTYELDSSDGLLKKAISKKNQKRNGTKYSAYHSEPRANIEFCLDLAWAFGLWFAEGSLSTRKGFPSGIRITLGSDERDVAEKFFKIITEKFNLKGNISECIVERNGSKNSWINVSINSNILGKFFESFGVGCKVKQIPDWILNSSQEHKKEFLKGMLVGDGCFQRNDSVRITLANPVLVLQLYKIGLELGKEMSLQMQEKAGKLASTNHVYTLLFRNYTNSKNRHTCNSGIKFEDGLIYCPIKKLTRTKLVEDVYDFTVEEDHSFSVAGVVVHNCFGSYISDNMTEILGKVAEVGMMSKMGGGTSAYFGDLRPRGAKIGAGGESSGPVHFMELFDTVADVINQGSARRGAFAAYLPIEHADIEEYLLIRSEGHPIQNMSIGVTVSDKWMQEMIDGDKQKRALWGKVIKKRCETGYPYIFFTDTVNNNAPEVYKKESRKIHASNLCVAGDQRVVSSLGLLTARELYEIGESLTLFDGNKKVKASKMELVEKNADVYKVTLENGLSHNITSYHKVVKRKDLARPSVKTTEVVECKDLKIGDYILFQGKKGLFGNNDVYDEAFLLGLWQADGTSHNEDIMIDIWENDFDLLQEVQEKFDTIYDKYNCSELYERNRTYPKPKFKDCQVSFSKVKKKRLASRALKKALNFEKGYIPEWIWTANEDSQWSYIRGLYYADGTVNVTNSNGDPFYLSITNTNLNFIQELQILLLNLGVKTSIHAAFEEGYKSLPDGNGGYKDYFCKKSYRLVTGNKTDGLLFEEKTGFLSRKGVKIDKESYRDNSKKFSKIKSIEYIGKEDVFCCTVDSQEHLWVCNGFVTHNCSEITLSSSESESFVCVLSSLNLLHWDEIVKTDAIETLVYFLDSVNEEFVQKTFGMKFMEAAHNFAKNQRALGMGVLGWHSLLQSKMIAFESLEAKMLNGEIWSTIRQRADDATHELAKLFGEPELLKGTGRRNVTTLAVAPTTSSSFILGQVSPSIEPENSNYYVKKLAKGSFTYKNPYLKKLLKGKGLDTDEIWKSILVRGGSVQHLSELSKEEKDVFKTFGEISQKEIVIQAAQRQRFIDQSQSLNFMIPSGTHPKQINELMIEAWKMGVKTLYYQRSSNPSQELSRNIMTCTSCES